MMIPRLTVVVLFGFSPLFACGKDNAPPTKEVFAYLRGLGNGAYLFGQVATWVHNENPDMGHPTNWLKKVYDHTGKMPRYGTVTCDFHDDPFPDAARNNGVKEMWDRGMIVGVFSFYANPTGRSWNDPLDIDPIFASGDNPTKRNFCNQMNRMAAPGTGVVASGVQSVQAFALFLDMLPADERTAALAHLVRDITDEHHGHLTTGIFGTRYMLDVLSRQGRAEIVNDMVNLRGFPGWRYMLEQGATTLWEHWKFSDNTFSHNHPMFGSVSQWFYNWLGGIEPAVDAVGFDKFTFQPQFLEDLDWVRCTHRSIRGPITCDWERQGGRVAMDLHVPANTSATLILPAPGAITENGHPAADSKGVEEISEQDGRAKLRLGSGRYHFVFEPSQVIRDS